MRKPGRSEDIQRTSRFEACETRLVMTAQPFEADPTLQLDTSTFDMPAPVTQVQQSALAQTGWTQAQSEYGFNGAGQTVVVIDTGIAYDHYALGGGFGAGYRVVGGWDFAENDANPYDDGPLGSHGSHVAGIIGSSDANNQGVASGVDLVSLRVFTDMGESNFGWIEQALQWVHNNRNSFANPITTVNISIGTNWNSTNVPNWSILENEFAQLKADGIFISVAAGNSFQQFKSTGLSYPAASPYVVPVMSVDANGNLSSFSQRDTRAIAAPGERITSTVPDYRGNQNTRADDFVSYSGTSMAAPYLAGASTLVRQAYAFMGNGNVNQDTINNLMRSTADSVFDPITGQSYLRLNVDRALDAIMPVDEYGDTAATAARLGSILEGTRSVSGVIGKLNDQDFFTFTADKTGSLTVSTDVLRGAMRAGYTLNGATGTISGNSITFNVQAGQSYTLGLAGNNALGFYKLNFNLKAAATPSGPATVNWGTIEQKQFLGQQMGPSNQFAINAVRDGILTVQASFQHAAGNVDFVIVNGAGQVIGSSASLTNQERIDVTVKAGQTVYLRAIGQNSNVDLIVTNLVSLSGNQVTVNGTAGNDSFAFTGGANNTATVNGVSYSFGAGQKSFNFVGRGGVDSASFTGSAGYDRAVFQPGSVSLSGDNYSVASSGMANVVVDGGAGYNSSVFYDSAGVDTFTASPTEANLSGSGFNNTARGFAVVKAYSRGGADRAVLYDSEGHDTLVARPNESRLTGVGFDIAAANFGYVQVVARGGYDSALFYDSAGTDNYVGNAGQSWLSGSGYSIVASNFERVRVYGTTGTNVATYTPPAGASVASGQNFFRAVGGGSDIIIYNFGLARVQSASVSTTGVSSLSVDAQPAVAGNSITARWNEAQQAAFAQWAQELQRQSAWNFGNDFAGELAAVDSYFRRLGRGR
ncbi:MAG: S8 family serine peptidase [Pirellulales bacterium]